MTRATDPKTDPAARNEPRLTITRGGYDWTDRYPWIVESALENRHPELVIDGPSLLLLLAMRVAPVSAVQVRLSANQLHGLSGPSPAMERIVAERDKPHRRLSTCACTGAFSRP